MISVLRVLLLKQQDSPSWSLVEGMMDQWVERSKERRVVEGVERMTAFFRAVCGMTWVSGETVQHCYGVLKTNSVSLGEGEREGQALYPLASILSHSCRANLEPVRQPGQTISLRAKRR